MSQPSWESPARRPRNGSTGTSSTVNSASTTDPPHPPATPGETVARIEVMRQNKWPASRIAFELHAERRHSQPPHHHPAPSPAGARSQAVHRPERRGQPGAQTHHREAFRAHGPPRRAKVGRIPAGEWRAHGKDSPEAKAVARAKTRGAKSGYVYLHLAIDGNTRLAYTEALENERAPTAVAFLGRARGLVRPVRHHQDRMDRDRQRRLLPANAFAAALEGAQHRRTKPYTPDNPSTTAGADGRVTAVWLLAMVMRP
jgi:hypothetical protein